MKVYEFKKNVLEKVIIQISEFKGKKLVAISVFYNAGENKDDWKPNPKRLFMLRELISKLKEGVDIEGSFIEELLIFED